MSGSEIVAAGTPRQIVKASRQPTGSTRAGSYAGAFLKPVLARAGASRAARDGAEDVEAAE